MSLFLEALAFHGRNSAAVAATMGVDESVAYNLIARHVGATVPTTPKPARRPYKPETNRRLRERLRKVRLEERGVER